MIQSLPPSAHSERNFYVIGGTLRRDAPSYVARQADEDLFRGLTEGHFCYVLTSRQMGKSSLMVRTAARLREAGVTVVILDLTSIGQNVTVEQWYDGLVSELSHQLDLEDQLEDFWLDNERLGPLQRWMRAIREIILPLRSGRLVIFIDEIDSVRSLPFSTDEFFAGIREFYNRRTEDTDMSRLTFCLLGVATPSDLIRDTRTTPFNIGQRIELNDFSNAEAEPLAHGMGREQAHGAKLLQRVLFWTGGHPYLTQRLCLAVAEDTTVSDASGVDRLCEELFLSHRAQERDDNLLFVRERLLRSEADRAALLDLYGRVRKGKQLPDQENNPLIGVLRLSGVVRVVKGRLQVRNRIYKRVFDPEWIKVNMPDAELQRQRAAYRKGLARAATVAGVVVAVISALALYAVRQRNRAVDGEVNYRRLLYTAQMNLAQQALEEANIPRVEELLIGHIPLPGQADLRGFEWMYLWRFLQLNSFQHRFPVLSIAFSPDGARIISGGSDHTIRLWDIATGQERGNLIGHSASVNSVAFSDDGKNIASGSDDHTVKLWDAATGRQLLDLRGHSASVQSVTLSPDGKRLASGGDDGTIRLWDTGTGEEIFTLDGRSPSVHSVAFSPNGKIFASGGDNSVVLWNTASGQEILSLRGELGSVDSVVFSPDGKHIASGNNYSKIILWEVATGREIFNLVGRLGSAHSLAFSPDGKRIISGGHETITLWDIITRGEVFTIKGPSGRINSVAFSPDGKSVASGGDSTVKLWDAAPRQQHLENTSHIQVMAPSPDGKTIATGDWDHSVKLWDRTSQKEIVAFNGHSEPIQSIAFSPDGKSIASGSDDQTVRLWDVAAGKERLNLRGHTASVITVAFSPDGGTLASSGYDNSIRLWDTATGRETLAFKGHSSSVNSLAFSPDGKLVASGGDDNTIKFWDVAAGREVLAFKGHTASVITVAFSPDGGTLASSSYDNSIRLWDIATGRETLVFKGHYSSVKSLAFSPDGKRVASGDQSTIKLWDVFTGQQLIMFKVIPENFSSLAFSLDGTWLAIANGNIITIRRAATKDEVAAWMKQGASK